jgi:hypothetical protein
VHDLALIREVATASKLQQQEAEAAAAAAHSQQQQQQQQCPQSPTTLASPAAGEMAVGGSAWLLLMLCRAFCSYSQHDCEGPARVVLHPRSAHMGATYVVVLPTTPVLFLGGNAPAGEARSAMCSPVLDTSSSQQRLPLSPLRSNDAAGLQPDTSAAAAAAAAGGLALPPGSHAMPSAAAADDTAAGVSHGSELGARHILDCYLGPATYSCAAMAAGGAIDVAVAVARGEAPCGAAIIRPPGHHAEVRLCLLCPCCIAS